MVRALMTGKSIISLQTLAVVFQSARREGYLGSGTSTQQSFN